MNDYIRRYLNNLERRSALPGRQVQDRQSKTGS